jgi:hypothetical protein
MAITFWRLAFNGITAYGNGAYDLVGGSDGLSNLQALCFRCNAGQLRPPRSGLCVLRAASPMSIP